jgi:hypothetical protein
MELTVKVIIEREITVNVPIKSWEKATDEERLLFAKKQVKEEMYIDAQDDEFVCISYAPENKEFPKYRESIKESEKLGKYEKQK